MIVEGFESGLRYRHLIFDDVDIEWNSPVLSASSKIPKAWQYIKMETRISGHLAERDAKHTFRFTEKKKKKKRHNYED